MVLHLSERFVAWKCYSWQPAFRPLCSSLQSISEAFAAWKQHSWISANRSPTRTALPINQLFEALKTWLLRINKSKSFHDCTTHILKFRSLNKGFLSITKLNTGGTALPIIERFADWIRYSWASANRPSSRTVLLLSESFTTRKCHS